VGERRWPTDPEDGIFSAEQERAVARIQDVWREAATSGGPTNRSAAEHAVRDLYRLNGLDEPAIRWCCTPAELVAEHQRLLWIGSEQIWQALGQGLSPAASSAAYRSLGDVHGHRWTDFNSDRFETWMAENAPGSRAHFRQAVRDRAGVDHELAWSTPLLGLLFGPRRRRLDVDQRQLWLLITLAQATGPWIAHPRMAPVRDRPSHQRLDEQGRLHCWDDVALGWPDGPSFCRWHGIPVDERLVREPALLGPELIQSESNVEVRRVMLERFGLERFLAAVDAREVDTSRHGRLYESWTQTGVFRYVEVQNATLAPDGTRKRYMLLVPAHLPTARAAVAWTFGLDEDEYVLAAES
jgi:hypothetical protein